jgi:hypothetical protein
MIKQIRIENFRSLVNVTVDLDPLTVLIGRSGTGKSNFVEAIRFLRDSLNVRNMNANVLGGVHRVRNTSRWVRKPCFITLPGNGSTHPKVCPRLCRNPSCSAPSQDCKNPPSLHRLPAQRQLVDLRCA